MPLVINDRVDVALAIGCDGVHIGWDDMAPADARRLLGPDAIIGLTINSPQRADATDLGLIDYAGIGGVYGTTSKVNQEFADRHRRHGARHRGAASAQARISRPAASPASTPATPRR